MITLNEEEKKPQPTSANKKKHTALFDALEALKAELPQCFKRGKEKQPLAIGIHHAVLRHYENDTRFSATIWQQAIKLYVNSTEYLENMVASQPRIDVTGNIAGHVTEAEAAFAKKKLAMRLKRQEPKEKANVN